MSVPADDVHIALVRLLDSRNALPSFTSHIPNLYTLIRRTRAEDSGFGGTPLDIFDAGCMRQEGLREGVES